MRGEGATWHENQLVPVTRHGKREDVWWTYGFSPIDDENAPNGVGGVLVVCNDVTDRHRAFEAVAESEERLRLALAGAVIGTWDWHVQTSVVFGDEPFAQLYGMDPGELRAGTSDRAFLKLVHPDDREPLRRKTDQARKPWGDFVEEFRLLRADGAVRWVLAQGRCHHDASGRAARFKGATLDITERKEAEQHRIMLTNELSHRVKNTLATVQAVAESDAERRYASRADARNRLSGPLGGHVASAGHSPGERPGERVEIVSVVKMAIEPHAGDGDRFRLRGPDVAVSARSALTFSMALHELATNAAKYGALSRPEGRVDINWRIPPSPERAFELTWSEADGPR